LGKTRLQWAIHLLIRFEFLDLENSEQTPRENFLYEGHNLKEHPKKEFLDIIKAEVLTERPLPDYFNKEKLRMIDIEQSLWFDEYHRKASIGTDGLRRT
jgi:hypothetical protein